MQADPHKLDFRNDLMARLPGSGGMSGLGGLGVLGGTIPPTHDLTRPGGLFAASGGYHPKSPPSNTASFHQSKELKSLYCLTGRYALDTILNIEGLKPK